MSGSIIAFNKGMDSPILREQLYSCEKTRPKQKELFNIQNYVGSCSKKKRGKLYLQYLRRAKIVNPFFSE